MSIDALLRIEAEGCIRLLMSKVEIGQGIQTAMAQIAAEELDVALERVQVFRPDTALSADASYTAGSNSIQTVGEAVRRAAADARQALLAMAAEQWQVGAEELVVEDGTIRERSGTRETSYWALMGGRFFGQRGSGLGRPKSPEQYAIVGRSAPRPELLARVRGEGVFVQDLQLPGMVYGRVVRPPGAGALLAALDEGRVRGLPGVLALVRDGSFLGVLAGREEQAQEAARVLRESARWQGQRPLPQGDSLYEALRRGPAHSFLVVDGVPVDGEVPPVRVLSGAARTLRACYFRPFQLHAALGPSAALALWEEGGLQVWSHTQGVFPLRASLAKVLGMAEERIRVRHAEGAGCYGHNGADDAALDAALLARALPGRPVLLQWTREDEHRWEPCGSAMVVDMQASLDAAGQVVDWNHDVHSYTHSGRPRPMEGAANLLAAWHLQTPLPPPRPQPGKSAHGGIHRNADPLYHFAHRRVVKHFVEQSPLRVSALRGLGAFANVFAIESFMDELALEAGCDPVEFRLRHLRDERARAVIEAAAERAGWVRGVKEGGSGAGRGQGLGFAQYKNQKCYAAVVVELRVQQTGEIDLERVVVAADAGQIVNPDGLANQLEGGVVQASSWALKEEVRFSPDGIESADWESYPILRLGEAPEVETVLLDRPGLPSLGCGEAAQGPTPAAIANAVFAACGARLRQMPFVPERVRAALAG